MTEKLSAEEVAAVKSIGIGHSYMPDKNARSRLRRMGLIESVPSLRRHRFMPYRLTDKGLQTLDGITPKICPECGAYVAIGGNCAHD